jgi:hypothetical protein
VNVSIADHLATQNGALERDIADLLREIEILERDPSQGICYEHALSCVNAEDPAPRPVHTYFVDDRESLIEDLKRALSVTDHDDWLYEDCYYAGLQERMPYWAEERLSSKRLFSSSPLWTDA